METNNKLREALVCLRDAAREFNHQILNSKYNGILDKYTCEKQGFSAALKVVGAIVNANYAIAAPARNCDIGTAQEQAERFENFCLKHIGCAEETGGKHCVGCPLEKASENTTQKCELYWAQLPYESEEAK